MELGRTAKSLTGLHGRASRPIPNVVIFLMIQTSLGCKRQPCWKLKRRRLLIGSSVSRGVNCERAMAVNLHCGGCLWGPTDHAKYQLLFPFILLFLMRPSCAPEREGAYPRRKGMHHVREGTDESHSGGGCVEKHIPRIGRGWFFSPVFLCINLSCWKIV